MNTLLSLLLEILFPKHCIVCKHQSKYICLRCQKGLQNYLPECYICRRLSNGSLTHPNCQKEVKIDDIKIIWKYNNIAKELLKAYKYSKIKSLSNDIHSLIIPHIRLTKETKKILVQIPLHISKENLRGFNQLQPICIQLKKKYNAEFYPDLLVRNIATQKQAGLNYSERSKNVNNIFSVNAKYIEIIKNFEHLIIIDDVLTSGATMESAARSLRIFNPNCKISGLILFRGNPAKKVLPDN